MAREMIFRNSQEVGEINKLMRQWVNTYLAMGTDISKETKQSLDKEYRQKVPDIRKFEFMRKEVAKAIQRERGQRHNYSQGMSNGQ